MIIRKSQGRDRDDEPRRRASSRGRSRCSATPSEPGVTTAELDAGRRGVHPLRGRRPDLQGLPRLPRGDLHLAELDGRPRDPRARTRSRTATSSPSDVGVTLDGFVADSRLHVPGRRDRRRSRAPARGRARRRSTAGIEQASAGNRLSDISARRPAHDRGGRLLRRPDARRPRHRPLDARGSADPELRRAGPRPAARRGDDARDRADDQRRRPRRLRWHDDRWSISTRDDSLVGPFRAHGRDHGRTARSSSRRRSRHEPVVATMHGRGSCRAVPWSPPSPWSAHESSTVRQADV